MRPFKNILPKITLRQVKVLFLKNELIISDLGQFIDSLEKALKYLVATQDLSYEDLEKDLVQRLVKYKRFSNCKDISEKVAKQIMQFWTKENHIVFDMIQIKGTQYNSLEDFNWSVNLKTYGKSAKNLREASAIFDLNVRILTTSLIEQVNNFEGSKNIVFELNKEQLDEFVEELDTIEANLNNILARNAEEETS